MTIPPCLTGDSELYRYGFQRNRAKTTRKRRNRLVAPPLVSHSTTEASKSVPELMPTNVVRANKLKEQIQHVPDPGFIEQSPFPFQHPTIIRILRDALNSKTWYELPNWEH